MAIHNSAVNFLLAKQVSEYGLEAYASGKMVGR